MSTYKMSDTVIDKYYSGLEGLSAQDRQDWEKQYSNYIQGKAPDEIDKLFKQSIVATLLNSEKDTQIKNTIGTYDLYNNDQLNQAYDRLTASQKASPLKQGTSFFDKVTSSTMLHDSAEQLSVAWAMPKHVASQFEQDYQDAYRQHRETMAPAAAKFGNMLGSYDSSYKQALKNIQSKQDNIEGIQKSLDIINYNISTGMFSDDDIDEQLAGMSSLYATYGRGNDPTVSLSAEEKRRVYAEFTYYSQAVGQQFAVNRVNDMIQNMMAEKQSTWDKSVNGLESFGESFIGGSASFLGFIGGALTLAPYQAKLVFDMITNPEKYKHMSPTDKLLLTASHIWDNRLTNWGERLSSTGVWGEKKQLQYEKEGKHDNMIFNSTEDEEKLLHKNTIFELGGAVGFTAQAIATSMLGGWIGNVATKGAKAAALASRTAEGLAKARQKVVAVNKVLSNMPMLTAAGEASMMAVGGKNRIINQGQVLIDQQIEKDINQQIINLVNTNPEKAEQYAREILAKKGVSEEVVPVFGSVSQNGIKYYTENDARKFVQILGEDEEFRNQIAEATGLNEKRAASEQVLYGKAITQGSLTFATNMAILTPINRTVQLGQQSAPVRRAVQARASRNASQAASQRLAEQVAIETTGEGAEQGLHAVGKKVTRLTTAAVKGKEALAEGFEEYSQFLEDRRAETQALSYLDYYMNNIYDKNSAGYTIDTMADAIAGSWYAAQKSAGVVADAAFSKEAIRDGLYGMLGTLMPTPMINTHVRWGRRNEGQGVGNYLSNLFPITVRSALVDLATGSEAKLQTKNNEELAIYLNDLFQNEEVVNALRSSVSATNFLKEYHDALDSGDPKKIHDAKFRNMAHMMGILYHMQDTAYAQAVEQQLKERQALDPKKVHEEKSIESEILKEYCMTNEINPEQMTDQAKEQAIERVKESAQEMQKMLNETSERMQQYEETFGEELSVEAKNAMNFNDMFLENGNLRIKEMEQDVARVEAKVEGMRSEATDNENIIYAEFGSVAKAKEKLNGVTTADGKVAKAGIVHNLRAAEARLASAKHRAEKNDTRANRIKVALEERQVNSLRAERDRIQALLNSIKDSQIDENKTHVVSAKDILRMKDASARAEIFKRYKKDTKSLQGKEVEKAKKAALAEGITDLEKKIIDIATIKKDLQIALDNKIKWLTDPAALNKTIASARSQADINLRSKQYARFADAKSEVNVSYDTFREEAMRTLNSLVSDSQDRRKDAIAARKQMEKSPHWMQYVVDETVHLDTYNAISSILENGKINENDEQAEKEPIPLEIMRNLEAAEIAMFMKGVVLRPNMTTTEFEEALNGKFADINQLIPVLLQERNPGTEAVNLNDLTEYFIQGLKSLNDIHQKAKKGNPDQGKPSQADQITPENNMPKNTVVEDEEEGEEKIIAAINIELSAEELPAIFMTNKNIRDYVEKHSNLSNPSRLSKLKRGNQVYFYFPQELSQEIKVSEKGVTTSYPVAVAMVVDKNGSIELNGKRYSAIQMIADPSVVTKIAGSTGITTSIVDGKTVRNVTTNTLLDVSYTVSETKVRRSNDKNGKKYSIAKLVSDAGIRKNDFLNRIEVGRSKSGEASQLTFKHDAGAASRTSDIFIADSSDIAISRTQDEEATQELTVFDVLNKFLSGEMTTTQALHALDYLKYTDGRGRVVSNLDKLLTSVGEVLQKAAYENGKLHNSKEVLDKASQQLNIAFHNLYTLGNDTTFRVSHVSQTEEGDISLTLSLGTSSVKVSLENIKDGFIRLIADQSMTDGQVNKISGFKDGKIYDGGSSLKFNIDYSDINTLRDTRKSGVKTAIQAKWGRFIDLGILTTTAEKIALDTDRVTLTPNNAPGVTAAREEKTGKDTTNPTLNSDNTTNRQGEEVDPMTGIATETTSEAQNVLNEIERVRQQEEKPSATTQRETTDDKNSPSSLTELTSEEADAMMDDIDIFGDGGPLFQLSRREKAINRLVSLGYATHVDRMTENAYNQLVKSITYNSKKMAGTTNPKASKESEKERIRNEAWKQFAPLAEVIADIKVGISTSGYATVTPIFFTLRAVIANRYSKAFQGWTTEALENEYKVLSERAKDDGTTDYMYHLGKKQRQEAIASINRYNPNITQEELNAALAFLHTLENTPELNLYVKTVLTWIKNNAVSITREHNVLLELFNSARQHKVNIQQCKTPYSARKKILEELEKNDIVQEKMLPVDISKYEKQGLLTISEIKVLPSGEEIIIYNVQDNSQGQQAVCQILADSIPKGRDGKPVVNSPWCLAVFNYDTKTKKASVTSSADRMWNGVYCYGRRQIAMYNGFPIAFNSSSRSTDEWWNLHDRPGDALTVEYINALGVKRYAMEKQAQEREKLQHSSNMYLPGTTAKYSISTHGDTSFITIRPKDGVRPYNISLTLSKFSSLSATGIHSRYMENSVFITKNLFDSSYTIIHNRLGLELKRKATPEEQTAIQSIFDQASASTDSGHLEAVYASIETFVKKAIQHEEFTRQEEEKLAEKERINREAQEKAEQIDLQIEAANREYAEIIQNAAAAEAVNNLIDDTMQGAINNLEQEGYYNGVEDNITEDQVDRLVGENATIEERTETKAALDYLEQKTIRDIYNEHVEKPALAGLSGILRKILEEYHIEIIEGPLNEIFGEDALGAWDMFSKIVYLANEEDRNAITEPEEFSHAFITLMGAVYRQTEKGRKRSPQLALYSELRDLVVQTSLYEQVYAEYSPIYKNPAKIKEEALGQALAAMLVERYEVKTEADKNFFTKLKQWFKDVLADFKMRMNKKSATAEQKLQHKLAKIADSILKGTYKKEYLEKYTKESTKKRNHLVNPVDALNSMSEGRKQTILQTIRAMNNIGGLLAGSLSLAAQGTVYRSKTMQIHDLDFAFSPSASHLFEEFPDLFGMTDFTIGRPFDNFQNKAEIANLISGSRFMRNIRYRIPGFVMRNIILDNQGITIRGIINQGTANEVEIDIFANYREQKVSTTKLEGTEVADANLLDSDNIWYAKMVKFGRAKDIGDYQRFNPRNRKYASDRTAESLRQLKKESVKDTKESREQKKQAYEAYLLKDASNAFRYNWNNMSPSLQARLEQAKMTREIWERLTAEEKEKVLHCTI